MTIPDNLTKIETLYAFMSIDSEGRNGIVAGMIPEIGAMPMITGSRELAKTLVPMAEKIARENGVTVGLFTFDRRSQLWQSEPVK